jgi:hypothetical protein
MDWRTIDTAPKGQQVWTKIDDERGERNVAKLTKRGHLWFTAQCGGMYVYYAPTHWAPLSNGVRREGQDG